VYVKQQDLFDENLTTLDEVTKKQLKVDDVDGQEPKTTGSLVGSSSSSAVAAAGSSA